MIGLKELILIALVVLVLYGRSGVLKSRRFQTIWPWLSPVRRHGARLARSPGSVSTSTRTLTGSPGAQTQTLPRSRRFLLEGNRLFWFLTILAATAVAAWIVMKMLIISGPAAGPIS
jgi:hypothetical protein